MKPEDDLRDFVRGVVQETQNRRRPPAGPGSTISSASLAKGMKVVATYRGLNSGEDRIEILGVAADANYGEEGVKFNSVRDALKNAGVTSLRALEAQESQTGIKHYLVVRDFPMGDKGPWYYLFNGRWCRGSGAERLSFTLMQ